jgi:hypothetical protein
MSGDGASDFVWLRGFGGVKVNGSASWPARVCDMATVTLARKPDKTLVKSFGDNQFVYAKPAALAPLKLEDAEDAIARAAERVVPCVAGSRSLGLPARWMLAAGGPAADPAAEGSRLCFAAPSAP